MNKGRKLHSESRQESYQSEWNAEHLGRDIQNMEEKLNVESEIFKENQTFWKWKHQSLKKTGKHDHLKEQTKEWISRTEAQVKTIIHSDKKKWTWPILPRSLNTFKKLELRIYGVEEGAEIKIKSPRQLIQWNYIRKCPKLRERNWHTNARRVQNHNRYEQRRTSIHLSQCFKWIIYNIKSYFSVLGINLIPDEYSIIFSRLVFPCSRFFCIICIYLLFSSLPT